MGKIVHLRSHLRLRDACPSCTDDMTCVACYLDMKQLDDLEADREIDLEGYGDAR